jgi:hypothetical protein
MAQPPRDRRTHLSRQPDYRRLSKRVDRLAHQLEDAISYFQKVINQLGNRVSTLEKKLEGPASRPNDNS